MSDVVQLVSYREDDDRVRAGVLVDDRLVDVEAALGPDAGPGGVQGLLPRLDELLPALRGLTAGGAADRGPSGESDPRLVAPIPVPPKMLFAGANFLDHLRKDAARWTASDVSEDFAMADGIRPYVFLKLPLCVAGPQADIERPIGTQQLDYEVEMAAVIGKPGRHIRAADAFDHIAGFVLVNDVSCRDLNIRKDWPNLKSDWFSGKNFASAAPMGPFFVPAADLPDWRSVRLELSVNGEGRQSAPAGDMTFDYGELIEFVSGNVPLQTGDIVAGGTPSGVGFADGRFLEDGDVVEARATHLGGQRSLVVASQPARSTT
jgi:2,4-diketo-3-deoxy-L-fuconate hydrolase